MSIEIKIRKNEPIDRAIRRMKKKLERENIIKGTRAKRYFEKPCEKRRRREKVMAFTAMLRRRHADEAVGSLRFCRRPINFGWRLFFRARVWRFQVVMVRCVPRFRLQLPVFPSPSGRLQNAAGDGGAWLRPRRA